MHTSWVFADEDYENALTGFVQRILATVDGNPVLADLQALGTTLAWFGALNSLSMTLIKYASPGVPDLYQGNELTDLSLVDPDNRRPVDYVARAGWLDRLAPMADGADEATSARALAEAPHDGGAKLWILWRLLALRSNDAALFRDGSYTAIEAEGASAHHVLAFMRQHEGRTLIVAAGRLFVSAATGVESGAAEAAAAHWLPLGDAVWGDTVLRLPGWPDGTRFRNQLTGETLTLHGGGLPMADVFRSFPGAALVPL